jgi:acyl dehydratase
VIGGQQGGSDPSATPGIVEDAKKMSERLYLEDMVVGQKFGTDTVVVEIEKVKAFAAEFDPQSFHLDEVAARESLFGGLVASGWHTAALSMRLLVEGEFQPVGGLIGLGVDQIRWPRPVRPGDVLRVESEVLEVRESKSNPERGIVKVRNTTLNQDGEPVMIQVANLIVPRRPS